MAQITISNPVTSIGLPNAVPFIGPPTAYTAQVDHVTNDATGGTFVVTAVINGVPFVSAAVNYNASAANLASAINAAVNVQNVSAATYFGGNVTAGSGSALGSGTAVLTQQAIVGGVPISYSYNIANLTGGANYIVDTVATAGVPATYSGIIVPNGRLVDTNSGAPWVNVGTQLVPVWVPSGANFAHNGAPTNATSQADSFAQTGGTGSFGATVSINGGTALPVLGTQIDSFATAGTGTFGLSVSINGGTPIVVGTSLSGTISAATLQSDLQTAVGNTGVTCTGGALGTNPIVVTWSGAQQYATIVWTINNGGMSGGNVINTPSNLGGATLLATITAANFQVAVRAAIGNTGFTASGGALGSAAITTAWSGAQADTPITWVINNTGMSGGTVVNTPSAVGTAGTFAGSAGTGATLLDYSTPELYCNTGTLADVDWVKFKSLT